MFHSMRMKPFVAACLLCGAFVGPTAFAGPFPAITEIDGEYMMTNLGGQPEQFPLSFSLFDGVVTSPSSLIPFSVPNLGVTINPSSMTPVILIDETTNKSDFTLSGGASGSIAYNFVFPEFSANTVGSEVTLASNTTTFNLSGLNPALLTLFFSPAEFDPHWSGFNGPVPFKITPIPEPATIVHLTWVGLLGLASYWRGRRRVVGAAG